MLVLVIAAQVFQPRRTNPDVPASRSLAAHVAVPAPVQNILQRACGDCHSNATVWPWYSRVAPVSWLVTDDVNEGRRHINFQDWEAQENAKEATEHLGRICTEVRDRAMPPRTYQLMHKDSRLSPQDVAALCEWSQVVSTDSTQSAVDPSR